MSFHCPIPKHHRNQLASSFDLGCVHVAAGVGVAEHFLADWNGSFDLSVYQSLVEEF